MQDAENENAFVLSVRLFKNCFEGESYLHQFYCFLSYSKLYMGQSIQEWTK